MKSLTWLLDIVLAEAGTKCDTDTHRDKITVSRRTEAEGMSFLTITLPNFCKDFEKSLSIGMVDSSCFPGFRRQGALPAFLRGLLSQIFDPMDGKLLLQPSKECIIAVRQICLMHKKILIPCSNERENAALQKFEEVENELRTGFTGIAESELVDFAKVSGMLWSTLGSSISNDIEMGSLVPKHGPGATAEKISGNSKFQVRRWHSRLERLFPMDQYLVPNMDLDLWEEMIKHVELVDPAQEDPVRIVLVPKTLKAPRIIAIEPVCNQYIQQALLRPLVKALETTGASEGHVNFRDQKINQDLALSASKDRKYATLDMSDASDRVHEKLVDLMLYTFPVLKEAVFACRSTTACLPSGRTVQLSKFASMGSGLCFPIESMVFFTICILSRLRNLSLPITPRNIYKVSRDVYIYGDDIIIPTDEVSAIATDLSSFLLKVNYDKTFGTGMFRESCGMDAYDGTNVTPCYSRRLCPSDRHSVPELVSFISLANQLYFKGWWTTARRVREATESILGSLPIVRDTSPGLGWNSVRNGYSITKWDSDLQSYKVKTWVIRSTKYSDPLDGGAALLKYLLKMGNEPSFDGHLEHSVRSGSAAINRRWVQPF
jgi:hypothetical protein